MNDINIIENFISKDTCDLINNFVSNRLIPTPQEFILGGPAGWIGQHKTPGSDLKSIDNNMTWPRKIIDYDNNPNNNIAIDIISLILNGMTKVVSDRYKEEYVMRSFFCGVMLPGGKNTLHMDNTYINADTKSIEKRTNHNWDKSGILYLNDEYTGGNIVFPLQDLKLKPKPGTFIFFEGNEKTPHEVQEVESGKRNNIITFFIKKDMFHKVFVSEDLNNETEGPETQLTMSHIEQMKKNLL